eukprot:6365787-Prymnesium_polylepis.1
MGGRPGARAHLRRGGGRGRAGVDAGRPDAGASEAGGTCSGSALFGARRGVHVGGRRRRARGAVRAAGGGGAGGPGEGRRVVGAGVPE